MLMIGRALMARPKLLLMDEPSLGLSPVLIEQVFAILARINREGVPILLVEQNARVALAASRTATCSRTAKSACTALPRTWPKIPKSAPPISAASSSSRREI